MLTNAEKEQLRGVLEAAKKRLAKVGQSALNYSMNHERNIGRDSIDESMEEELFSTEMRLHDREKYLLGKIDKQLVRLAMTPSTCARDCGEKIAFKRLLARPVTTLCIDCKEQNEREEAAVEQAGQGAGLEGGGLGEARGRRRIAVARVAGIRFAHARLAASAI